MRRKKTIETLKVSFGKTKEEGFSFELIRKYFENKKQAKDQQTISERTCNDLDFEELFMFLDRTQSKIGQQYLYDKLRRIPSEPNDILSDEKIIDRLTKDELFRIKTQLLLKKLQKDDAYYLSSLFQEKHLEKPKWFPAIQLLSFTNLLAILMIPFNIKTVFVLMGVSVINIGIHYWNKKNLNQYLSSVPQLLSLKQIASSLHKMEDYRTLKPELSQSIKTVNQLGNRMSFFQLEANLQNDFEMVFWLLLELLKITFLLEPLLLFSLISRLNSKRAEIEELFCFVGHIDSLLSVASLRSGLKRHCQPQYSQKGFCTKNIYHPLITNCHCNSISLKNKSVLLTGSNMSGKTSFIRTIGINIICGQTINTCFADHIQMHRQNIYSAIRISDDLINNKSYYFEEVLTIKEMINESKKKTRKLFLLDEIFKGTNTIERISAAKAVLSALAKGNNAVFVSTHDIELADMLSKEYELYHFSEIVNDKNIDFDYTLKKGKLKNRNAIRILEINSYPKEIVEEAFEISKILDQKAPDKSTDIQ